MVAPLRVCFVGLKCYDLLVRAPRPRYFGGAERQEVYIARGLAARGHRVTFVTLDYGQDDGVEQDGITIYKSYATQDGLPGIRFFHPRWSGLTSALERANADIYYQMGADSETGQIASWCRRHGRRFVFATASDSDCERDLPRLRQHRRRWLYRYGLRRADAIIVLTNAQQVRLQQSFELQSMVIRSCTPDPGFDPGIVGRRAANRRPRLLWVGRFVPVKRLEILLNVAAHCPDIDFDVAGSGDRSQHEVCELEQRAGALPNVSLHGAVFGAELDALYLRANLLVCTSSWEGVPNAFLEGWARGLPVVSTVDPDGMIEEHRLGAVVRDARQLGTTVRNLLADPDLTAAQLRAREYFLSHYTVEASVFALESLFTDLHQRLKSGRSRADSTGPGGPTDGIP